MFSFKEKLKRLNWEEIGANDCCSCTSGAEHKHKRSWGNGVESVSTSSSSLTWWPEWATSLVEESWPDRQQSKLRAEQSNCLGGNWIETRILFLWPSPNMLYDRQWRSVTHQYMLAQYMLLASDTNLVCQYLQLVSHVQRLDWLQLK